MGMRLGLEVKDKGNELGVGFRARSHPAITHVGGGRTVHEGQIMIRRAHRPCVGCVGVGRRHRRLERRFGSCGHLNVRGAGVHVRNAHTEHDRGRKCWRRRREQRGCRDGHERGGSRGRHSRVERSYRGRHGWAHESRVVEAAEQGWLKVWRDEVAASE